MYTKRWREKRKQDPEWVESERIRNRLRAREYLERNKDNQEYLEKRRQYDKEYNARPEVIVQKRKLQWKKQNIPNPPYPETANCECCKEHKTATLNADHCHTTGRFRGWLCGKCNLGIGKLGDNLESLLRAVEYLKRHESN